MNSSTSIALFFEITKFFQKKRARLSARPLHNLYTYKPNSVGDIAIAG